jgi:hypothetical protein
MGATYDEVDLSNDAARKVFYEHQGFYGANGPYGRTMPKVYERIGPNDAALVGGAAEFAARFGNAAG